MSSNNNKNPYITTTYDNSLDTYTTYVHANPSNFRAVVQRLTGSSSSSRLVSDNSASFRLHERRQQHVQQGAMRKLEMIKLNNNNKHGTMNRPKRGNNSNDMVSPVSTLDGLGLSLGSPTPSPRGSSTCTTTTSSSMSMMSEENERAFIALSPLSSNNATIRNWHEPQLLPLFPLHSPKDS